MASIPQQVIAGAKLQIGMRSTSLSKIPRELYWKVMEYLDYESAANFAQFLMIDPLDSYRYHKFTKDENCSKLDIYSGNIFMLCSEIHFLIGNDSKIFKALLINKSFRKIYSDQILFIVACRLGYTDVIATMLKWKNINPSVENNLAFLLACQNCNFETVKLLLKDPRVDPSAKGNEAIRFASIYGDAILFHILLSDPRVTIAPEYPIPLLSDHVK